MDPIIILTAKILTAATVIADIAIAAYIVGWAAGKIITPVRILRHTVISFFVPHARILAFIVALSSLAGSLFYSEIVKYPPCVLCWWQRIFAYPQVLLIAMGIIKNDKKIADYTMALSLVGMSISVYQYYIQLGGNQLFQCDSEGGVSCTLRFPLEFGYVTLPMMGITAFAALFILMRLSRLAK